MAVLLRLSARMRRRLPGDDLDHTMLPVLRVLAELAPVRHTDLAERVQLDASTVSRHVRHLEERGMACSRHDDSDGRVRLVELLPEGRRALEEMLGRRRQVISEVVAGWPEEDSRALRDLLAQFESDLESVERRGATPTEDHEETR